MKKRLLLALLALAACVFAVAMVACSATSEEEKDTVITVNGQALDLTTEGAVELSQLSVENGVTVNVDANSWVSVTVNGEEVTDSVDLDITAITSDATIDIAVDNGEAQASYTVNLLPEGFGEFETEGESATEGDYYVATYESSGRN